LRWLKKLLQEVAQRVITQAHWANETIICVSMGWIFDKANYSPYSKNFDTSIRSDSDILGL
jgi:hypothetical protein